MRSILPLVRVPGAGAVGGSVALAVVLIVAGTAAPARAQAKTTASWFDINPNRSNTDDSNPNGASGGRVNHVGAAGDFSKVYAATEWGGLYHSFNQGVTWARIQSFAPSAAWDVKVDPRNSQQVYATSSYDGRVVPLSGINISSNAGVSWRAVNIAGLNPLNCTVAQRKSEPSGWQIAISPVNTQTVFVGTNCGLARTVDGGANWTFIDPSPGDAAEQIYAVLAQGPQIVDVIGDNGYFRSSDNGVTWSPVLAPPGPVAATSGPRSSLAASPAESYVVLAADQNNIFETENGGLAWTSLTLPTRNGQSNRQGRIPFIRTNQLSSSTQFDVWFGDVNLFKATARTPSPSSLGGPPRTPANAWTNVQNNAHWDVGDVMFDPRFTAGSCPSLFTNDGGVYRNLANLNPNCQIPNWEQPTITPHATWLWGLGGVRLGQGLHALSYGLQDAGGFAATLVTEGHNPPLPNWNNYTCCDVLHNTQGGSVMLSLQGASTSGRAFRLFKRNRDGSGASEIPNYPTAATFSRFESGAQNAPFGANGYVVNLSDGVYFTNNITSNPIAWTSLNAPTAVTSGSGNIKIATLGGQPNVFYHTANGNPEATGVIFRSTLIGNTGAAPGSNWVALPLPGGITTATAWDVDPTNGNRIIISGINPATNNFEVWRTTNFGVSWSRLQNLETAMLGAAPGVPGTFVNRVNQGRNTGTLNFGTYWQPSLFKFNPLDPTTIVAGAVDAGVFLSLDNGSNWQLISRPADPSSNAPHIPRPLFAYFSPGRFNADSTAFDVWVGTRGAGVQKVVLETR